MATKKKQQGVTDANLNKAQHMLSVKAPKVYPVRNRKTAKKNRGN
jgi:hypothetical protein